MHPKLTLLSISLSLTLPLISALGCYNEGVKFSDLIEGEDTVDGSIANFCETIEEGFKPGYKQYACYQFGEHKKLDISVENTGNKSTQMFYQGCFEDFQIERSACLHGSVQQYDDFLIDIDPNSGDCPALSDVVASTSTVFSVV